MQEILLIDKPKGITSFDCIRILRKKLGIRKMGHAGTLDPMATGLMIIGVGEGTKRLQEFLKLDKTYEAEILLGVQTDTGDITGKILKEVGIKSSELSEEKIRKTLQGMVGKLELPVPAYSAIKRGGEALYKKARRGEVVDAPIKIMEIQSAEFLGVGILPLEKGVPTSSAGRDFLPSISKEGTEGWLVSARFSVTSGTYIRSLAEELGRRLGVQATLAALRRTRIGEFKIEDAQQLYIHATKD
ncbi:MAG: tRNA pseudouridine(55) synthase TruB [bacterium]|nr:tRNA pseudouridine(55) synthase TruB [bacterium]